MDPEEKCQIPHVFRTEPAYRSGDMCTFASECCGEMATATQKCPGSKSFETNSCFEWCIDDKHTTREPKCNSKNVWKCRRSSDGSCTLAPLHTLLQVSASSVMFYQDVKDVVEGRQQLSRSPEGTLMQASPPPMRHWPGAQPVWRDKPVPSFQLNLV